MHLNKGEETHYITITTNTQVVCFAALNHKRYNVSASSQAINLDVICIMLAINNSLSVTLTGR